MPTIIKFRRGTTAQNNSFTGSLGEISVDTELKTLRVHDSATAGGFALVNTTSSQTISNKTIGSDLLPSADSAYDLGSASFKWKDLYLSGNTIFIGDATISADGTSVVLPAGSTIEGAGSLLDSASALGLLSGGTGVTYNSSTGAISIGQDVATSADVSFNTLETTGNLTVGGNLIVNGTTTTINSTTLDVDDLNITIASGAADSAAANGAGLTVDGANATLTYNATGDTWDFNKAFGTGTNVLANYSTDELAEGSNLYYTDARVRAAVSATGDLSYDSSTGVFSLDVETVYTRDNFDSDFNVAIDATALGGTGLTYNSDTNTLSITDTGVAAGTYGSASQVPVFTVNAQGQLDSAGTVSVAGVSSTSWDSATGNLIINTADGGSFYTNVTLDPYSTTDLSEGTNLYYTSARADSDAKNAVSVTDAGGDGSLTYNASTGVFTYTGPSAAEVRAHFSGGTGISITDGTIATTDTEIIHDNLSGFVANEHIDHSTVSITAGDGLTGGGDLTTTRNIAVGAGTGITVSADAISTNDGEIVHDSLSGFVANEHIDHSSVTLTAGTGLTGGGDLTVSRTFAIDSAEFLANFESSINHDNLTGFVANEHINHTSVNITAGAGLTGGGDITSTRTLNIGEGTGITVSADAISTNDGEIVHDNLSGFVANEHINHSGVTLTAGNGLTGGGDITSSRTFAVGAGTGVTVNANDVAIGQDVATTADVTFGSVTTTGNVVVGGNLQVTGTTTTVNAENLEVADNMIYMNSAESDGSPTQSVDVGWAANVNDDGSYEHVGMFRDATDNTFKVFEKYTPEPDAAVEINTGHASFQLAPFAARTLTGKYLGADSDIDARLAGGTGITYSSGTISTNDSQIVHDNLSGFVANEHINHSTVSITAGNGLTGGGTIAASRTLNIGEGTGITVSADAISTNDAEIVHDNLSGFVANEHIDHSTVSITAGSGLTGGGTIAATRTLNIGQGTGITVSADAIATNDAEIVHDNLSGFVANEHINHSSVSITAGNGLTGGGDITTTRTINVGAGTAIDVTADAINVDLSELSTSTTNGDGDYFVVVDTANAQRKLTKGNINISGFNNDAGFTTNIGDITGVTAGTYLTGGGTSGSVTLNVDATTTNTASKVVARDASGNFAAGTITATLNGNASTATTATNVTVQTNGNNNETVYLAFVDGTSFGQGIEVDTDLTYNPSTNTLTATTFSGALSGNATTATTATNVSVTANNTNNETVYPTFVDGATGAQGIETDTGLTYNPSTGVLASIDFNSTSDMSLKDNIETIADAADKVSKLRGVNFNWKHSGADGMGVIAQEVEKIIPEVVNEVDGIKKVSYGSMVGLLIEAIKDLQQQVNDLKKN